MAIVLSLLSQVTTIDPITLPEQVLGLLLPWCPQLSFWHWGRDNGAQVPVLLPMDYILRLDQLTFPKPMPMAAPGAPEIQISITAAG